MLHRLLERGGVLVRKINIAILGASGYTGAELLRWLRHHPQVHVAALTGESQSGKTLAEVYPHLGPLAHQLVRHEEVDFAAIDVVFCCLPHGTTQSVIAQLPNHLRVIDLSADFRLFDVDAYVTWYGHAHQAPALQETAVYGLSEWRAEAIARARLVANPGCYPTSILLPLLPLLEAKAIAADSIIVDSMSGVTGAGRKAVQASLYCEVNESVRAYGVGAHRHVAEIEQELALAAHQRLTISFTPHLVPMNRGISSTIHVQLAPDHSADTLRSQLQSRYADSPFVQICAPGHIPSTAEVRGTNQCRIAVVQDRAEGMAIMISVIDNLGKGASGQAIQNLNLMMGWPQTTGLEAFAIFP